ncbi:hypothetical protein AO825_11130 [Pectobacterium brasiliense]|nr:hypothetical protein KS44_02995 [Pectobacterium brasiliense]KRF62404.1 hypothetical protein AO825_11130 [Pectobacterium brasiliense]
MGSKIEIFLKRCFGFDEFDAKKNNLLSFFYFFFALMKLNVAAMLFILLISAFLSFLLALNLL